MLIGVLSDTHNDRKALQAALEVFRAHGVRRLIHCGDLTRPEVADLLEGFQVHYLYGNMDRDPEGIRQRLQALDGRNTAGLVYEGEIEGVPLAATHGHLSDRLEELVRSRRYRLVFHGHTHRRRDETRDGVRIVNPGALGGIRWQSRSCCLVDLGALEVRFVEI